MRTLFGPGTWILGGGALLLIGFLVVGFLLPGSWEAEVDARLPVAPETIRPLLDSPEGWQRWTTWPDSGLHRSGPDRGAGAQMAWSDRELGSGHFRIDDATPERVDYSVEVAGAGGSALTTSGTVRLEADGEGTVVHWREAGDLGSNPLMGYWALSMEDAQRTEMAKSLDRLAEVASAGGGPATPPPADTVVDPSEPDATRSEPAPTR